MRTLLVEDDDDLRREIGEFLRRRGHDVTACGSLAQARATFATMAATEPPEAVICDVNLPDGNGVDFLSEAAPKLPACRWVLMSGGYDPDAVAQKLEAIPGPPRWTIVEKPVSMRTLDDAIRMVPKPAT